MKTFKHKETGETATYEDGVMTQGRCSVEVGREPSSEFWEEVVEKDFEILSTKLKKSGFIVSEDNFGKPTYYGKNETIHSVKRLSDGK